MLRFAAVAARDLEGRHVLLPDAFAGEHNLVLVAFKRSQQAAVDTWVEWWQSVAPEHPGLGCYEVPVIPTRWSPARGFIDGGMARAVPADARRRTLTVYSDVRRVADGLEIPETNEVTALLVGRDGWVRERAVGPVSPASVARVLRALTVDGPSPRDDTEPDVEQFAFEFDSRFRPLLASLGVTSGTAHVTLTRDRMIVRFGPWSCETELANVQQVCTTGPYRWYRAIGARGSFADRGVTFGTTIAGGVCALLRDPVPGLTPFASVRHPGITVTVADRDRFAASLRRRTVDEIADDPPQ